MNWVDLFVALTVVLATVSSLRAGFLRQAFAIIGIVLGAYGALTHHDTVAASLATVVTSPALASIVASVLIFILVWLSSALLSSMAYAALRSGGLAWADHVLGMVVGLSVGLTIVVGILLMLARVPITSLNEAVDQSLLASFIFRALPHLQSLLPGDLRILRSL